LRSAMGGDDLDLPPDPDPMWFVRAGEQHSLWNACDLILEDGAVLHSVWDLPPDLPLGYHELRPLDGSTSTWLVVTPGRCPVPERAWGWAVQLYAMRSEQSWGIGDLVDLRDLARWSARLGAKVAMISPLHAAPPSPYHDPSPYFATSRIYRNVLYLRIEDLPGADTLAELPRLVAEGRALNDRSTIDRGEAYRLKMSALNQLFDQFMAGSVDHDALATWRRREGTPLQTFAIYCALAEVFGIDHGRWPAEYRHPGSSAVQRFAEDQQRRIRFHEWCQWQVYGQLAAAGAAGLGLISDVAVGFDPTGADSWAYQDLLASDCRIGAPPDEFSALGQEWGLPPFVPWKLRAAHYEPLIRTLRSSFDHCAGIRIDHVMGLFRLYWIPPGAGPTEGGYVRYASDEVLDLVALEAERAGGFVVGEDLGTVEDEVRAQLNERQILSYRLLWFEDEPTDEFPVDALAAITTHDLPTIAGVFTGADLAESVALGLAGDGSGDAYFKRRLHQTTDLDDDTPVDDVVVAAHRELALAPSLIRLATLEDALAVEHRPNVPGTVDERPNWRLPLPKPLELLEHDPLVRRVAAAMEAGTERAAARLADHAGARAADADAERTGR
jgi:4-alpha-glucanotransferase